MTPARGTSTGMRAYISVVLLSLQAAMIVSGGKKLPPKLLECIQHVSLMLCNLMLTRVFSIATQSLPKHL